jgi:hypothetical protein
MPIPTGSSPPVRKPKADASPPRIYGLRPWNIRCPHLLRRSSGPPSPRQPGLAFALRGGQWALAAQFGPDDSAVWAGRLTLCCRDVLWAIDWANVLSIIFIFYLLPSCFTKSNFTFISTKRTHLSAQQSQKREVHCKIICFGT